MTESSIQSLVASLAIGIAFFIILTYTIDVLSDSVVTVPALGIGQALAATEKHLEKHLPEIVAPYKLKEGEGLRAFGLAQVNNPHFEPVKLVFVHRNGTQFLINQTDNTVLGRCDLSDQNLCYTDDRSAQDLIKGHIIYVMEVNGQVTETMEVGGRYIVDAINGKILYPTG